MILKIFTILFFSKITHAIIGYDCGTTMPNITTFSLLDSGECDFHETSINSTNVTIELIQVADFRTVKVIHCKIEIHRTVNYCGIFGHLIPAENSEREYLYEISHENCKLIHETGIFKYDNMHTIADLKVNSSTPISIDFAGSAAGKSCSGAFYADNFGSWDKVFVHGMITITIVESIAQVNLNNDKLRLSTGTSCRFSDKHCIDIEDGHTFWEILPDVDCFKTNYDILYKGVATKFTNNINHEIIYTLESNEITFALSAKDTIIKCNREFIRTEHPKLLIYERPNIYGYIYDNDIVRVNVMNVDLFTYVNSKFVYMEKHLRMQLNSLYLDLITQRCNSDKDIIQNSLSLATLSPDEFAFNVMKKPGYLAKVAGEVVHISKCTPKVVKIQHLTECYNNLPVISGNETWFLTPKTHILIKEGKQINCNPIIPTYYKIGEDWIKFIPQPSPADPPNVFQPNTKISWKYKPIDKFATNGVYAQKDLEEFQQHLIFPLEKPSILNSLARELAGQHSLNEESINNLFSKNTLKNIMQNIWDIFIQDLIECGSISSSIIMLILIIQTLKFIIDTIIQGYTIHAIYGWSLHLFAAIFSSITHLLVVLNTQNVSKGKIKTKQQIYEDTELKEIIIEPTIRHTLKPPPLPNKPPSLHHKQLCTTKSYIDIFSIDIN